VSEADFAFDPERTIIDFRFMSGHEAIQRLAALFGAGAVARIASEYEAHNPRAAYALTPAQIEMIARPNMLCFLFRCLS